MVSEGEDVQSLTDEFMILISKQPERQDGNDIYGKIINLALAIFGLTTFCIGAYNMK